MKTITKKIAKNGAEIWYVDGKRVSREIARAHERNNRRYQEWLERVAAERINDAIEDYAVTVEAQDAAIEAEIEQAIATAETKSEEDTEMKNQNTNAVSTPAIETRIASNGAVSVYVNGKRTSREEAIEIAEQNDLPTYTATCYPYSERNYCINEDFATALSAYKWMMNKANSNRNVADGSFVIKRYTDGFKNETTIYDFSGGYEKINADDEPEFATFIYAENSKVYISERYERMILFHDQLISEGLTEEQINQVLVAQYNNANGREHCNLIKEFKAQNAAKAEIENAAHAAESEPETISTDERIAEIENEIAPLVEEMKVVATGLQMFKEYPDEYTQEFIDERENLYDSLSRKYRKLVGELESLQKTPPENPAPESAETPETTPVDAAIETLDDDMKDEVRADIEPYKTEYNAAITGIYLDDLSGGYDEDAEIIPAADLLQFIIPLALTDHSSTAYRKNPDGSFTEDKIAYERLCAIERKIFNEPEPEPEPPEKPASKNFDTEYLNANAPEGWTVTRADKKINVDYHGKRVAEVDRITERDLLVPHAFFQQFQPLVDKSKTPEQIFLDDRYRELAELEEMREELQHTPPISKERLKTLDDMINQVKCDIYETEMDNPDTVASFCKAGAIDEDGNVWF